MVLRTSHKRSLRRFNSDSRDQLKVFTVIPDGYEQIPSISIERFDGTFTHFFQSKTDPHASLVVIGDKIMDWTPYFEGMMQSGALKGK